MNITTTFNHFRAFENIFRCPVCFTAMTFRNENSIVCESNHCFDLSKYGYINFAPQQSKSKYTKEMFESRRRIFQSGFYNPLSESIEELIEKYFCAVPNISILDVGCGEGFFTRGLFQNRKQTREIFAMDILKEAVILASKGVHGGNRDMCWLVGDLSNIPMQSNAMNLVLNIFTPANYHEFSRIMKSDGILIKVVPSSRYLHELRNCTGVRTAHNEYSNEDVLQYFGRNMECLEKKHLCYQLPTTKSQVQDFIKMTPLMFDVDISAIETDSIHRITIDVDIVVGRGERSSCRS